MRLCCVPGILAFLAAAGCADSGALTGSGAMPGAAGRVSAPGTWIFPGENIQAKVDSYPARTQFLIKAGVHHRQTIVPKRGNAFVGEPGAILDGDGVTRYAFETLTTHPDSVVIRGLIIQHYVPNAVQGAIQGDNGTNWLVEGNEVRNNAETGVRVGAGWRVRNNAIHHNGVSGIAGYRANGALVDSNTVTWNNTSGANPDGPTSNSSGMKFFETSDLVIRDNIVRFNDGMGIWCDGGCYRVVYEGNTVSDNSYRGIFHEISYDAVIRNNLCERNGTGKDFGWPSGGGIVVVNSPNVEVSGNTVRNNGDGITGLESERGTGARGPYVVSNLYVHDNTIVMPAGHTGLAQYQAGNGIFTRNNRFERNTYVLSGNSPLPFALHDVWLTESQWRSAGFDVASTIAY